MWGKMKNKGNQKEQEGSAASKGVVWEVVPGVRVEAGKAWPGGAERREKHKQKPGEEGVEVVTEGEVMQKEEEEEDDEE